MRTSEINTSLIDGYVGLLHKLSPYNKFALIDKLKKSVAIESTEKSNFKRAFGAFQSSKSAEQIIDEIRSSRVFNIELESF